MLRFLIIAVVLAAQAGIPAAAEPPLFSNVRIEVVDRARLSSDQTGIIASAVPLEGEQVAAGTLVIQIQDDVPRAQLLTAEVSASSDVAIRSAENETLLARAEVKRAEAANRRAPGTVSELELERLQLQVRQAELKREEAQVQLELRRRERDEAQALLATFRVLSPFAGVVTQALKHQGEAVRQGDPVLEIVSIDRVRLTVDAPLDVARKVTLGQVLDVVPAGEQLPADAAQRLRGEVIFVSPEAVGPSRTIRVHLLVRDNIEQRLVPGLTAEVYAPPPPVANEATADESLAPGPLLP